MYLSKPKYAAIQRSPIAITQATANGSAIGAIYTPNTLISLNLT